MVTPPPEAWMARALELARRGLYTTDPNPRVGCVLVKNRRLVGEGFHARAGEPHAEIHALRAAGQAARGAPAYVTLEPCSHQGRTGPCAVALIEAGVKRVVVAMADPNPAVAGRGIAMLREAGIDVEVGILEAQARELNPGFIMRMDHGRPFVRLKMAMSLDGRTAMRSGESQWITGPQARREVQRLRARSSAVLTGVESIIFDNSRLTVRPAQLELPDASFRPPEGGYFLWVDFPEGTDVARLAAAAKERGVVFVPGTDFLLEGGGNSLRLAYSGVTVEQIEEGVGRLAEAYRGLLAGPPPERAVLMCGSGVTACHNLLAMERAGLRGARGYAGSWGGWISDPANPVQTPA